MSHFVLRVAHAFDLPRLRALYVEMVAHHREQDARWADRDTAQDEAEELFETWFHHPRALLLVAEVREAEQPEIAGFGLGVLQAPHLALAPVRVGRLDLLAVSAAYRRRGIGRALARALLDWFSVQGAERIFVSSATANPEANAFWEHLGFVPFSTVRSLDLPQEDKN